MKNNINHKKTVFMIVLNVMSLNLLIAQTPSEFNFTGTPLSGTLYGQAQINNIPASVDDWVAAFDSNGNCAGAAQIFEFDGLAYINLTIYGDDATSLDVDEGINAGEQFYLRIYDSSNMEYLEYQSPLNIIGFDGWYANNGAPMIGYDDSNMIYNWLTVDVSFDLNQPNVCLTENPIDLESFVYPIGGSFSGPGVENGYFNAEIAGIGTHVITYEYSLSIYEYTVNVYDFSISTIATNPLCFGDSNGNIEVINTGGFEPLIIDSFGQDLNNLMAGEYNISAIDNTGCIASTNAVLEDNDPLEQNLTISDVLCFGDNSGTADMIITGGAAPYTVNWGDNVTPSSLYAGTYIVGVTDSNGCFIDDEFDISEPDELMFDIVVQDVSCAGGNSGSISIEVSGGVGNYITDWGGYDPNAISTGTYEVTVLDENGCSISQDIIVDEPIGLSTQVNVTHVSCHSGSNGSIDLEVFGGTGEYFVDWNGEDPNNLSAGQYSVHVQDQNGCEIDEEFEILEPQELLSSTLVTDISCYGTPLGSVEIIVDGGVGDYQFSFLDFTSTSNLPAGDYTYTVTDENGCMITEEFTIVQNSEINISYSSTTVGCYGDHDGSVQLNVSGGVSPYEVSWIGGVDPENLSAGNHYVEIIDDIGCSVIETIQIEQPEPLVILVSSNNASCLTGVGSIDYSISGGTGTYIINWNGINLQNTPVGTHNYYVIDDNGCSLEGTATVYPPTGICGCTIPYATNYMEIATEYDGMCEFDESGTIIDDTCPADMNGDGLVGLQDLLVLLASYGNYCE